MAVFWVKSGGSWSANPGGAGHSPAAAGTSHADVTVALAASFTNADQMRISSAHVETWGANTTFAFPSAPGARVFCVDDATGASFATGASIELSFGSGRDLLFNGFAYMRGIKMGSAAGQGVGHEVFIGSTTAKHGMVLELCTFDFTGSSNNNTRAYIGQVGSSNADSSWVELIDCTLANPSGGNALRIRQGRLRIKNMLFTGTVPATLFALDAGDIARCLIEACDFSGYSYTDLINIAADGHQHVTFRNCALKSGANLSAGTIGAYGGTFVEFDNCDSGNTNYTFRNPENYAGQESQETTLTRTSGGSDGTTAISHKIVTNANPTFHFPFRAVEHQKWNDTTGANVTVTMEIAHNFGSALTDAQIWLDVQYLGTASKTAGVLTSDRATNAVTVSGTAQDTSTASWDSSTVPTRANSTAYTAGQFIKVASNSGRAFICTVGGTSASSEPAGYASATDGSSVSDGTATFVALRRQKLSVTLSSPQPQHKGFIICIPMVAVPSATIWVDRSVTLS